jgi:2',3'-cyclic-nucleotide 2'-phosphodiesterase (5'-nucleotidase family)
MEGSIMSKNIASRSLTVLLTLILLFSMFSSALAAPSAAPGVAVSFTILHTNDVHGQLEASGSNPGMARVATVINTVRTAVGAANVLLVDAGDEMQGSLLSNLGDGTATGKGAPTIAVFNAIGYNVATFGNHEFDWGQANLAARTLQATYPYITANIVKNNTGDCATAGWTRPDFADNPYEIVTVGSPTTVKVAFIGVTTTETPTITVSTATAGLCFKDPADSILHYYDEMKAAGADVIVVLSHIGFEDGGYGYGIPVYGDKTLAAKLNTASKPVNLIIGGHSHTNMAPPATVVGNTMIVQAYYNGRTVGRADITVGTDGSVATTWTRTTGFTTGAQDPAINTLITGFASDPAYLAIVNQPIGYSAVDLPRKDGGNSDNMMGTFIDDAIYNYLNTDAPSANDIDIFFNNAGGIRADWCYVGGVWVNTGCVAGTHAPGLLTYGNMFTVLPFGNATVVGQMTGAQVLQVLNQISISTGVIQPAGLKFSYFKYVDANPGPQPYAWGAYDVCVVNKVSHACEPLDLKKTYSVGTNEFLAPAGGDSYNAFKYMTNISYWGDMLNAVNAYVTATYGTPGTAYRGPNGDGTLDGRITLNGDGDTTYDVGEIVPLTILHHNDSHGNLTKGTYVGYTQLATLIKQERLHNPDRTLLLNAGDSIQGDAMMYYFKDAGAGYASDGTILPPVMQINPFIAVTNSMNYTAMTLGNHEFNFGSKVFVDIFTQANYPLLGSNLADSGLYGINKVLSAASGAVVNVRDSLSLSLPSGTAVPLKVAILGITNHRVPNYELPSNIPGLTFSDPIAKAAELVPDLRADNDVVIALTHIGFTENPASVEIDSNVDTNLAATVNGIDAIIGGHSHTNPATGFGNYKFLPTILAAPNGKADLITQAYRYNNTLGEVVIGVRSNGSGGYDVVSQTGRYLTVTMATVEDAATKAIVDPYVATLATYNNKVIGQTTAPIDALQAFTQETNGANLQADAAMYELGLHGITPDFHLSGAMTNSKIALTATPSLPYSLTIANMFTAMPYENSLVVISMNGPQIKAVLERGYRNYYYYKYVAGNGGYSYYTTCMLDTNFGNQISYDDLYPVLPNGNNVLSLTIGGVPVDFTNATKYYNVSTVNYLAAGSCNFNNAGVTLWPLSQIVADTQYYVRDAVIDYITHEGTVSPAIEGRLNFTSSAAPTIVSIMRASLNPSFAASVNFTVRFSQSVTGVDASDFSLTKTGSITGESITGVSGGPTFYNVSVNTGTGTGTLRLDVPTGATIFGYGGGSPLASLPYQSGETYFVKPYLYYLPWIGKP